MGDETLNSSKICDSNKHNVIIIGGGMAGLAAANYFVKNGMEDFLILEARKRLGGRIISIPIKNHNVELGANWIHGVLGNPIFELAMANSLVNIINIPKPHKVIAATEDGKQVPFAVLHEIHEAYVCFLRRCEEYFLCQYLPPPDIHSVGEHINLEATIYLERLPSSEEKNLRRLIFDCLLKRETCISGCNTMDEIDLLEIGSYTELQGGNILIPSGFSSILETLTKNIHPEKIKSGLPVKKIIWDSKPDTQGVVLEDLGEESEDSDQTVIEDISKTTSGSDNRKNPGEGPSLILNAQMPKRNKSPFNAEVVCENGQSFYANHVICTIPLGVLKEHVTTLFQPSLPQYKVESIERLLFGTVNKIFLEYERPFLNPEITEIMLLWENSNFVDMSESWFKKIYSFSKVSETLLLGWVSGKEAEYMETLTMEEVGTTCTKILRKFLNDPFVPEPVRCVCSSWRKQPYTRGTYTAIAVGASQSDIESIAQPLFRNVHDKKPVLLFAGEHTHSSFYSTAHGAYLSGQTAARRLFTSSEPAESILECPQSSDLTSWIQGIHLEDVELFLPSKLSKISCSFKTIAKLLSLCWCIVDFESFLTLEDLSPHATETGNPVLLFAGEHTHSSFYSTAHGAYLSGQTAARRLFTSSEPAESILECPQSSDLTSWIQGIHLEDVELFLPSKLSKISCSFKTIAKLLSLCWCIVDFESFLTLEDLSPHATETGNPVLLFAGEHTHSSFYSTAHGAYLSGQTAARRLFTSSEPAESILECPQSSDLTSWIQGIHLEG